MAANTSTGETCGSCCKKLKELIKSYEVELGLNENNDGTKGKVFISKLMGLTFWFLFFQSVEMLRCSV